MTTKQAVTRRRRTRKTALTASTPGLVASQLYYQLTAGSGIQVSVSGPLSQETAVRDLSEVVRDIIGA